MCCGTWWGRNSHVPSLRRGKSGAGSLLHFLPVATPRRLESDIRLEIARIIQEELRDDEVIDQAVRYKIESQRRDIPEGGEEWDILYRRYYDEEMDRRMKVIPTGFVPTYK